MIIFEKKKSRYISELTRTISKLKNDLKVYTIPIYSCTYILFILSIFMIQRYEMSNDHGFT